MAGPVLNDAVLEISHKQNKLNIITNTKSNVIFCGISTICFNSNTYVDGNYALFQNEVKEDPFQSSINKMKGFT